MPIPEFIVELRHHIGHAPLWLIGCTAVVLRQAPEDPERPEHPGHPGGPGAADPGQAPGTQVLLVRRADFDIWSPVTGIVDPGEDPHDAAVREVFEETRVSARIESLVWVRATELMTHANGDQARYLDHCFRLRYIEGEPEVGDDENLEARWWPLDALPAMPEHFEQRIAAAVADPARPILGQWPA
ncbi:ADP-ribose pyrophosphatase YjhB (NUDIX family) [Kineosphaera limosa]|uniref:Nudix hydrolase domain-containing protein n=1 Tax=Kineosphaera limosa NBRC 100340 TaxID=1184609 RepID=K6VJQ3_9MICO|nr:NUDIX domain-containing protein [Kineosphaera limosa]NYE01754.1 ADP-ribose pyrophosphatase YjhB (NUDIX family) [Kineosphaera limosa]GAB96448.1 hypothetical protein KILIM_039_00220 [Kineosphaera limosa NBRC 100340]